MAKPITKAQYLRAKRIVAAYESQPKGNGSKVFTADDLTVLHWSISVCQLTEKIVDDEFASALAAEIDLLGVSVDYVSLDDLGYISVKFFDMLLKDKHINAVLTALNKLAPKI